MEQVFQSVFCCHLRHGAVTKVVDSTDYPWFDDKEPCRLSTP